MPTTTLYQNAFASIGASLTRYAPGPSMGELAFEATESDGEVIWRTPGVLRRLYVKVTSNDRGSSTVRVRKNGADGGLSVTVPASATGTFEDNAGEVPIASGDKTAMQVITGAGGTIWRLAAIVNDLAQATYPQGWTKGCGMRTGTVTFNNVTDYEPLFGSYRTDAAETTESKVQYTAQFAGKLQKLSVNIPSNARTTSTTIRSRKNGADGGLSVTIGAGATGWFEDTDQSDAFVPGDLLNWAMVFGAEANTLYTRTICFEMLGPAISLVGTALTNSAGGRTASVNTTTYWQLTRLSTGLSESEAQTEVRQRTRFRYLAIRVNANTLTASSTLRFRKNAANGNQVITIGSSATGTFADDVGEDYCEADDLVNTQLVTGVSGTSLIFGRLAVTKWETTQVMRESKERGLRPRPFAPGNDYFKRPALRGGW